MKTKTSYAVGATAAALLIAASFGIFTVTTETETVTQQAGKQAAQEKVEEPEVIAKTEEQAAAPSVQSYRGGWAGQSSEPGPLQKAVKKGAKPDVRLSVGTSEKFPKFEQEELKVKVGQVVALTFRNGSAASPPPTYSHSWVLVQPDKAKEVGMAAVKAGPQKNYIPQSPYVLANTDLLPPGESQTIVFQAPSEPGDYPFICTFPGHHTNMKGVLHVEEK